MANIDIASDPPGAKIYIDSMDTFHVTPASLDLVAGEHTYLLMLEDYIDVSGSIIIAAGTYYVLSVPMMRSTDAISQKTNQQLITLYTVSLVIAVLALLPTLFGKKT